MLAEVINDSTLALECIQPGLNSLAMVVKHDGIVLEFLLWDTLVSTDHVERSTQKLMDKATWPSKSWH